MRVALFFVSLLGVLGSLLPAQAEPPNIVFFLADDLGWTGLSSFGSDFYETPNLDRLAAEGMRFTDAYAACTVCSPTRASLMTGKYPGRLNLTSFIPGQDRPFAKMIIPDWTKGLKPSETTLPEALRDHGYETIHIGKWHLEFPEKPEEGPTAHGFDFSKDKPMGTKGYFLSQEWAREEGTDQSYLTDYLADLAVEKISETRDAPFFLYFAFHVPHTPIQGREDLVTFFEEKVNPEAIHVNPTYAAMVKSMDLAVGQVLASLESNGLEDNTLVVFTSDNGGLTQRYGRHDGFTENLPLRRGKGSAYEGGVRVSTIAKYPGVIKGGSVSNEPVITADWMPTLLDFAGVKQVDESASTIDGVSLRPVFEGEGSLVDRNLYWHFPHYHAGGDGPYSAIRSGDWKLIERHENGALELYDLGNDLAEANNLAATEGEKAEELLVELNSWREKVDAQMMTPNPQYDPERATEVMRKKR